MDNGHYGDYLTLKLFPTESWFMLKKLIPILSGAGVLSGSFFDLTLHLIFAKDTLFPCLFSNDQNIIIINIMNTYD